MNNKIVRKKNWAVAFISAALIVLSGCGGGENGTSTKELPTFSLAWSEYPSWSVFGVADVQGILNGKEVSLVSLQNIN